MSDNIYYVYLHRKATDNEVFYVGKGSGKRARHKSGRNQWWKRIVAKHGFTVEILESELSEDDALDLEAETIKFYKENGHTLCNMNDGGGQGYKFSEEVLLRIKNTKSGEDFKRRMRLAKGRKVLCSNGMIFDSARCGAKWVKEQNGMYARVSSCCRRERTQTGGYVWRWLDDCTDLQELINKGLDASEIFKCIGAREKFLPREIECSNGMIFPQASVAVEWLRANGFPNAVGSKVASCCLGITKTAYGFKFWYTSDVKNFSECPEETKDFTNHDKILDKELQEVA